jgi:hypothetical protein
LDHSWLVEYGATSSTAEMRSWSKKICPTCDECEVYRPENADDSILAEELDTIDPFMEYVYLGDDVSDGIFAWISFSMPPSSV